MNKSNPVITHTLANGLTILIYPDHQIPKVSTQLWYGVGSKDEKSGERGLAHLLEHMIFKGTEKLSESDINVITNKLSGTTNAFTSYDYTGYLFDMPSQHWKEAFDMFADCMTNCTFKDDLLKSELKAVIQELKMYRDNYGSTLVEEMIGTIFADHPYHNPIIGYKQDLWSITREGLLKFYKKHYVPNNATLIVVGDVEPTEVIQEAEKKFGSISPNPEYQHDEYYHNRDLVAKSLTLYRDVQQPLCALAFSVPGARSKNDFEMDILSWALAAGRGSILYKLLVDQLDLVTEIDAFSYDLFDEGLFFVEFVPKNQEDIGKITSIIQDELRSLIKTGLDQKQFDRAYKKAEVAYVASLESNQNIAYGLGKNFLATGDPQYLFTYVDEDKTAIRKKVDTIINKYLQPTLMHKGFVLPMEEGQSDQWSELQAESDTLDTRILSAKVRESEVEAAVVAEQITPKNPVEFSYPQYDEFTLPSGLEVIVANNTKLPKVDIILEMKTKHFYDPEEKQGIGNFVSEMLLKGTKKHTAQELAYELESRGMSITTSPGYVSMGMLADDLEYGLELLVEILSSSQFDDKGVEQTRAKIISDIQHYWDSPSQFIGQLVNQEIYKQHPYHKNLLGSIYTVEKLQKDELEAFYKQAVTPHRARMAIVGDLSGVDIQSLVQKKLADWEGPSVDDIEFGDVQQLPPNISIDYPINRDQVVLAFAGKSIARTSQDFDKLLLFEQVFSGGVLNSMSSRLFAIREQSGLFYTISGSLLARSDKQPGIAFVKTIVSLDRLAQAEELIKKTINEAGNYIEDEEFSQARNALVNSLVDNFETNRQMASTFLFLKRYGFPKNYFDTRAQQLLSVTPEEVMESVKKILNTEHMLTARVGRLK